MITTRPRTHQIEVSFYDEIAMDIPTGGCLMNRLPIEILRDALKDSTGQELVESGSGWMACCPAHKDRNPSLSVSEGNDGRVLLNCFAGCSTESVLAALGLTASDLFPENPENPEQTTASMSMKPQKSRKRGGFHGRSTTPKPNTVTFQTSRDAIESLEKRLGNRAAAWTYHDAEGGEAGAVIRWDLPDGGKTIRPICHSDDGWSIGAMLEPRPLYRLPCLSQPKTGLHRRRREGRRCWSGHRVEYHNVTRWL